MIPYDDLVNALTTWRARQGLPVAGAESRPSDTSMTSPAPGSGPTAKPGSGPTRGAPPAPPPGGKHGMYQPPPLASPDTTDEALDDAALLEEAHYDNEGDDYAMNFAALESDGESTTMGSAPDRDSFSGGETEIDPKSRKPW
jgi:hypothetical protein